MMKTGFCLAFTAVVAAESAPKYDDPAIHAYADAAADLKHLLDHVKSETHAITSGKIKGSEAIKALSNLQSSTKKTRAKLGMTAVVSATVSGEEQEKSRAERYLEGLQR